MIVVDASVVCAALADDGDDGDRARARLVGEILLALELLDIEVISAWRRLEAAGQLDVRRVDLAMADLLVIPLRRVSHRPFLPRCWELRATLTAYDAAYVAVAEAADATLVTTDRPLARSPAPTCTIDLLESATP